MMSISERNGGSGWVEAWSVTAMGCYSFYQQMGPMAARYVYALLFLIANFVAWGLRENPTLLFQQQRFSGCKGNRDCFAAEAVLMVSFTVHLFFLAMFLSTVYTRSVHDLRNSWHSKWWVPKIVLLASCFVISVFAPTFLAKLYGKVAPFGAGLFMVTQLISVIRYITRLNSRWCGQEHFDNHHRKVNIISILAYSCSMVWIIFMVFWYVGCYVNAALVLSTLVLVYIMAIVSALSKAKGFYMEPTLIGVYIVFLCWSAIKSEPETRCYEKENTGSGVHWITMISFIAELASVTVAAFSTGTDYKCIQFTNVVESENDVPYGYGFFHFVFATGCMYFGMLFLGWDTHHALEKWSMDVGWTSTIVHIVNEGLAVIFFVVVVLARFYGIGWLQQLLGKIFGTGGQQLADESRATGPTRPRTTDNNSGRRPGESPRTTEHDRTIEMGSINRPPPPPPPPPPPQGHRRRPSLAATERAGTGGTDNNNGPPPPPPVQGPHATTASSSSSSSMTTTSGGRPLRTSEPREPVLGRRWGEIQEEW